MQVLRKLLDFLKSALRTLVSPQKLLALPRKLVQLSLPAAVAWLVFLFLLVCVAAVWFLAWKQGERGNFAPWLQGWRVSAVVLLIVLIPIVVYYAVKLFLEDDEGRFPDIDFAWKAGLAELERRGLAMREIPLFLMLGSEGMAEERALFEAAELNLAINHVPDGEQALHWYVTGNAIFLACSKVGCLSQLAALARAREAALAAHEVRGTVMPAAAPAGKDVRITFWPTQENPGAEAAPSAQQAADSSGDSSSDSSAQGNMRRTLFFSHDELQKAGLLANQRRRRRPFRPANRDAETEQRDRLAYLCRLLTRARRPLCPVNGVLMVVPLNLVLLDDLGGVQIKNSVSSDLATLVSILQVRCTVITLVTGWEDEPGFHELVRRIGPRVARNGRIGRGALGDPIVATSEDLEAYSKHACSAFEEFVYAFFKRDTDKLGDPSNRQLYSLLCKVHRYLERRLDMVLVQGLAEDNNGRQIDEPLYFAGCYFGSAGTSRERQTLVKGVIARFVDPEESLDENVAWTNAAREADKRYHRLARFGWTVAGLCLVTLAVVLYRVWRHS